MVYFVKIYSYGVAICHCCAVLKISFTSLLPLGKERSPGSQRALRHNPKSWDTEISTYSLLLPNIRGSLPGAGFLLTSAALLIPPSIVGDHPVSSHPIQLETFKRLTSAWILRMEAGPGADRVDNHRLKLQKMRSMSTLQPNISWALSEGLALCQAAHLQKQLLETIGLLEVWRQERREAKQLGQIHWRQKTPGET